MCATVCIARFFVSLDISIFRMCVQCDECSNRVRRLIFEWYGLFLLRFPANETTTTKTYIECVSRAIIKQNKADLISILVRQSMYNGWFSWDNHIICQEIKKKHDYLFDTSSGWDIVFDILWRKLSFWRPKQLKIYFVHGAKKAIEGAGKKIDIKGVTIDLKILYVTRRV